MKKATYKSLLPLVIDEAHRLKANTTKDERARLDFTTLDVNHVCQCIYGQMTGDCTSTRAIELIEKSCDKIIKDNGQFNMTGNLSGSPKDLDRDKYWSPIESFIYLKENRENGNNERLVAFLKGKSTTLKLKEEEGL